MSYSDPQHGEEPYVGYRKVTARKEWPCTYGASARRIDPERGCEGTIAAGDAYIDEVWVPWTPEFDEVGEDDYGRPMVGQVGVVGSWGHTRYHEACEKFVVDCQLYGTPAERAADEAAFAKEQAAMDKAHKSMEDELLWEAQLRDPARTEPQR